MKNYRISVLLLCISFGLLLSCGPTDSVVVVDRAPGYGTTQEQDTHEPEEPARFVEISVGLIDPVTNLDPPFAANLSTMRIISMLFDGLVSLGGNGEYEYNLASEIDISDNGLVYTVQLNRDHFYRDSAVFPSGVGRRIHAGDVKYAFERTAAANVPAFASGLLMNVQGYENYFLEQRTLFDDERRVLEGVDGIRVVDAETLEIELLEPDDQFIRKLASPWLAIYPQEAVENNRAGMAKNPVGTGAYYLNNLEENTIALVRNDSENGRSSDRIPSINRINVQYFGNESELMREFAAGNVDLIPEIGPQIKDQVLASDGGLAQQYAADYAIQRYGSARAVSLFANNRSDVHTGWLFGRLSMLTAEDFSIPGNILLHVETFEMAEGATPESEYYVTLTDDFYTRAILNQLNGVVFQPESSLVFFDIRVPTRRTSLFSRETDTLHKTWADEENEAWFEFESEIISLYNQRLQNMEAPGAPWAIHINDVTVREPN